MIVEPGYTYPPAWEPDERRQSDRWLSLIEGPESVDGIVPRLGEGGFLETDDMADVHLMIERSRIIGTRCG